MELVRQKRAYLLLVIMVCLSLLLVGCGGNKSVQPSTTESQGNETQGGGSQPVAQEEKPKINFPTQSITYSIPFDPGGQSDIEARRQQPILEEILGTSIVITYKPGGGGAVGWTELVNQKPDGYFIAGFNIPHIILQPLSDENVGYKTEDINPIAIFQATPVGLAVHKDSGLETLADFIEHARQNPGAVTVAGSGTYSGHHITHMLFEQKTGTKMQYIPFTGAAQSVQGFLGKNTMAIWANSSDLVAYKDEINILAIGSENTFYQLPDVPTFLEEGIDLITGIDRGVAAPPGTDPEIMAILEDAFLQIANDPAIIQKMHEEGFEPKAMGAQESREYINKLLNEYKPIMEELKASEAK